MNSNLRCPYCEKAIALTWRRSFIPTLRTKCPHCGHKSLIDYPLPYIAFNLFMAVFVYVSARLLSLAFFGPDWRTAGFEFRIAYYLLLFAFLWIPLDRLLTIKIRRLHKM